MFTVNRWSHLWHTLVTHRRRRLVLFLAVLLPLYLFGELAEDVVQRETFVFDDPLLLFAHHLETPVLDRVMVLRSRVGYQWGVVPLDIGLLLLLLLRKHIHDGVFFGLSVIGAAILNQAAKGLFGRARPKLWPSIAPETTFSFPSGHAMGPWPWRRRSWSCCGPPAGGMWPCWAGACLCWWSAFRAST